MICLTVQQGLRYADIDFPCGDDYLTRRLTTLGVPGDYPVEAQILRVREPRELSLLEGRTLNLDEVNFLAKRFFSFDQNEMRQFFAAAQYEGMTSVKDLINLTYNLPRYTVVQDMSSMDTVGRTHMMNINGFLTREQEQATDFAAVGRSLVRDGKGVATEYGVLFKNDGVPYQEAYDGQNFPDYAYDSFLVSAEMRYLGNTEYLYLPCDECAIQKAAMRLGATPEQCEISLVDFNIDDRKWFARLSEMLQEEGIFAVNEVAAVIDNCDLELDKLEAVLQYADRHDSEAIVTLAEYIDEVVFIPDIDEPCDVADYFLNTAYGCELPEDLADYLDLNDFGDYLIGRYGGRFVERGFVFMEPGANLDEILYMELPDEGPQLSM